MVFITTAVGTGVEGFSGDGDLAAEAQIARPWGTRSTTPTTCTLQIRATTASDVSPPTVPSQRSRAQGSVGSQVTAAPPSNGQLSEPRDVRVSAEGSVYIADTFNRRVRRVDSSGTISTVAGSGERGFGGAGRSALAATLSLPSALALDADGDLYISDSTNHSHPARRS